MKINFGSGSIKMDGYLSVDVWDYGNVDILYKIGDPLPLPDNSVDEVFSMHCFEHIDDIFFTMHDLFRVCKDGAVLNIISPHFSSPRNCYDMEHRRQFGYRTFEHIYGLTSIETLQSHAVDGNFVNDGVWLEWWEERTLKLKPFWKRALITPVNLLLNYLANKNVWFCERFWIQWVPSFDNIHYRLIVRKNNP